ncbi:hypothetical protein EVAR_3207_1 [Eumeta japonica]|uniref:Uncharacterized protein n=1 Tax=Eumeta variegata TaxID=151549 RepID=A0A4C1SVI2_EUMVA|nr:hypothetical protein EVAR_3207_1 [Eumeta japonica]
MYTDYISDKDIEQDDCSPDDTPSIVKKSLSTVGFRSTSERQTLQPLPARATRSLTGPTEELRLCGNFEKINLCNRVNVNLASDRAAVCPCGCLLRPSPTAPFRTRELSTLALHVVPPDVLSYQGYSYEPSQIAMLWKKGL